MESMKDIKKMSDKDLVELVEKKREDVRSHRFNMSDRNTKAARNDRTVVARALTELNTRTKAESVTEQK